ncbi:MAG: inositol oxygenase family protein [Pirellulaceae bacterium]
MRNAASENPLESIDDWDDDVARRYPEPGEKAPEEFRNYDAPEHDRVREFYRQNHRYQTFDFVQEKRREYLPLQKKRMSIWAAMEFLNTLVDESDPDTDLSQIEHLMQSAEAIRADGHPRWFILTGLIHDLGKILCLFDEPQWAVVGDTFPVGCQFSDKVVLPQYFADNPDRNHSVYSTKHGIYEPNSGLDNVLMSWGHDEYLYHVVKDYLPTESLYMIRYHSFYAAHREHAYDHLMSPADHEMFAWVRKFNPYDLYTKSDQRPDVAKLTPYYQELIAEFFPVALNW